MISKPKRFVFCGIRCQLVGSQSLVILKGDLEGILKTNREREPRTFFLIHETTYVVVLKIVHVHFHFSYLGNETP